MYKKLRRRFMLVSTLVLALVISAVVGVVYWIASGTVMSQTMVLMDLILDNGGALPSEGEFSANQETFLALNDESLHEARYFSALEAEDGTVTLVDVSVVAISEDDALALATRALDTRRDSGRLSVRGHRLLHYAKRAQSDGGTLVVLLDSTSRYGLVRVVLSYMALLWSAVLILYMVIMGRYSKKLVKPFIENDERQKRFITNASHELKTPLAVISANTEMTEVLGGKNKWTDSTRRQVKRLQSLIEDLVVLARLDEMEALELTEVDLSAVATEAAEAFRGVIETSGRRFESDIAPNVTVKGDKRGLSQLANILLDNAAKYCDADGTVSVRLERRTRGARLSVTNTYAEGAGVDCERFFERFYRQDESHNSGKSGFGIGLSMGREIAQRMKGKLKASYAGDSITFTVEV